MGGQINVAFRFSDGEACCFDRWTNNVGVLSKIEILDGDEQPVRDYIAMCRNNDYVVDHDYNGKPVRVSTSGYGLILIDFVSKTIIDSNGYTSLFGGIAPFSIRQGDEDDWHSRKYHLIKNALASGRGVIQKAYKRGKRGVAPIITRLSGIDAMEIILKIADEDRRDVGDYYVSYDIDTSPWVYHCSLADQDAERKAALDLARSIGFPMTRKEGLNKNYPYPKKRKASPEEIRARFLWMQMKGLDEYKAFDGVPWERLSEETKGTILEMGKKMTPEQYKRFRLQEFISATTNVVSISAG